MALAQSVADYEVTLQAGLSCCGHRKTGQPQGLSGARQWSESWAFSVRQDVQVIGFPTAVAAGERARQLATGCSDCAVAYYCKTGRQGASPVAAALVEVYWVLECPEQSQLTEVKNTIATALFHSHSNQHQYVIML